jgi:glycosyltransferase involved in cell wall biosynthesis
MLVSVVIPAFNAARHLAATLVSALGQGLDGVEVLVVDDGSRDATPDIARSFGNRVRLVRQENQGVSAARNRGLAEATGAFVALLDADDLWRPGKLGRQLAALGDSPGVGLCYTGISVVDEDGRFVDETWQPEPVVRLETLLFRNGVAGGASSILCPRELLLAAGGFDPGLSLCADWDMWIRLAPRCPFVYLPERLTTYRRHAANMSSSAALLERDSLRMLRKAFADPALPPAARALEGRAVGYNYAVLAGSYLHAGRVRDALRCAARALARDWRQAGRIAGYPARALQRRLRSRSEAT